MMSTKTLKAGDAAPEFILKDQNDRDVRLSAFRGRKVLLSFHPLAWTGVCSEQMKALEANSARFAELNTVPLGLSIDHVPCKAAWAKALGVVKTSLPADFWPHGEVAGQYGVFREAHGTSKRANIIVDEKGCVDFIKIYEISHLPDLEEIFAALKKQ